jgi:hypothetical protein
LSSLIRTKIAGFSLEHCAPAVSSQSLIPIDKSVVSAIGLPWFEISPQEAGNIIHGKPLEPLLEGKPVFSQDESARKDGEFPAAVFTGDKLAAIVEKKSGKWKYVCVLA